MSHEDNRNLLCNLVTTKALACLSVRPEHSQDLMNPPCCLFIGFNEEKLAVSFSFRKLQSKHRNYYFNMATKKNTSSDHSSP